MQNKQLGNFYYLMRHGESLANKEGLIISHEKNALSQYGLTANGADQVMRTALNTRLNSETIIISSDYRRCRETANIMHDVLDCGSALRFSKHIRERNFGSFELQDVRNYPLVWQQDLNFPEQEYRGVESVTNTLHRGIKLIESLEREFNNKKILLVSHGDVLQILLAHYRGLNARFHRSLNSLGNADLRFMEAPFTDRSDQTAA